MEPISSDFVICRKDIMFYYSAYNYLPELSRDLVYEQSVLRNIRTFQTGNGDKNVVPITVGEQRHLFLVRYLQWDSEFNGIPTYRLEYVLFKHNEIGMLAEAVRKFQAQFFADGDRYLFCEFPSEDIFVIQALCLNGFRLVETRISQYVSGIESYHNGTRYRVRRARESDIPVLRDTAKNCRNDYDRLHADVCFDNIAADEYLATYVENAVRGYCDVVIVPDEPGVPARAFVAADYLVQDSELLGCKINRIVLVASSPACKGWFAKLASEFLYISKEMGVSYVLITTQVTNRGSYKSVEKLGFRIGAVRHLFSARKVD